MSTKTALTIVIFFLLTGCGVHNQLNITNSKTFQSISKNKYSPHSKKVYVTRHNLPDTVQYEVLGTLEVGKVLYGTSDDALQSIADMARKIGADGVIRIQTWTQTSPLNLFTPHGSGTAIKLKNPEDFDWSTLPGFWK